jgi:hypothetical protein
MFISLIQKLIKMMHFIEEEPEKQNRVFWTIMLAVAIVVVVFIVEVYIEFYLNII